MQDAAPPAFAPKFDLLLTALLSAVIFVLAHFQAFTNPYVINDDVRQQIFWMQQWLDPALFKGDLLADYARHYVPWGVKGVYWLASWVMNPVSFSKVLPGPLFVFLALCLYRIGLQLGGRRLAWTTVAVYWLLPFFLDNLSGGLARGFAAPLLAFFWLCWQEGRPWGMGLALLLQALFIPYIFLVSALAAGLAWLAGRTGRFAPPPFPARLPHFLCLGIGAALVALMDLSFSHDGFGPLVSYAEMVHRPEFYAGGRFAILPVPSVFWEIIAPWADIAPVRELGPAAGLAVMAVIAAAAVWGLSRLAWRTLAPRLKPLWYLGLAGLLLYCLARIFLLKLFIPDRYLIYTLNLAYCLLLALGLKAACQVERWPKSLGVLALVAVAALGTIRLKDVDLKDYSAYRPVYAALAATPKDALIAGHPNLMDDVPTFAQRRALVTYELAQPWSRGYWRQIEPRLQDLFAAYYASDPQVVIAFCRKYQVSFLVVDDRQFSRDFLAGGRFFIPMDRRVPQHFGHTLSDRMDAPFFAPFDRQIAQLTKGRRHFALLSSPAFQATILDRHLRLLDMRPWLKANPSGVPPSPPAHQPSAGKS